MRKEHARAVWNTRWVDSLARFSMQGCGTDESALHIASLGLGLKTRITMKGVPAWLAMVRRF